MHGLILKMIYFTNQNPLAKLYNAPLNGYGLIEAELLGWLATYLNFT